MSTLAGLVAGGWLIGCALLAAIICAVGNRKPSPTLPGSLGETSVSPEWLAILTATEATPVYDALVCEQMERAEGWSA